MSRVSTAKYAVYLALLVLVIGAIELAKGGLYLTRHEGDAVHMIEILLRMQAGQVPHLDFSTPIGIFAFLPIDLFAKFGLPMGQAFIMGQLLVAVMMVPAILRVAVSRLTGGMVWVFGLVAIGMITALVHGENVTAISVSMYYNRWAWVWAFVAILLAVLPAHKGQELARFDGIIIGIMLALLALSKPTYFVSFVIPIVAGIALQRSARMLVWGVMAGLLVVLAGLVIWGPDFYFGYVQDLLSVTQSETRAAPGVAFLEILNGPRFLIGSFTLILSIVVLRQAGQDRVGLLLLLLAPGFLYTTYQNFGNDPKWLILLIFLLSASRPSRQGNGSARVMFNADARNALAALTLVSFALIAPSMQNMFTSSFRNLSADADEFTRLLSQPETVGDLYMRPTRRNVVLSQNVMVDAYPELADYVEEDDIFEPITFLGETLPRCVLRAGDLALAAYMADRLKQEPFGYGQDSQLFVADISNSIWVQGGFPFLKGAAPWYYSGTPGIENAEAIVVPLCPVDDTVMRNVLRALEFAGLTVKPPIKDSLMWVYPIVKE